MSFKQKLLERKAKPTVITLEVDGVGEMEFEIGTITLGELNNYTKNYPSLNALINGVKPEELDDGDKLDRTLEMLEAFNVIVAYGVRFKDGKSWVKFDVTNEGENAIVPVEVLPTATLAELGQLVIRNFRAVR